VKLKTGALISIKDRDFAARRFVYIRERGADPNLFVCPGLEYDVKCPVPIYQYGNIGPTLGLTEYTKVEDAYNAGLKVYAGYLMLDANLRKDLRAVGGARIEHTDQDIEPISQFLGGMPPAGARIQSTDVLPALALTYSATKNTKLRLAASETLARPQIRELSPFTFADFYGARAVSGNPQLKLTYIKNGDLRFEVFPTPQEVIAFSFFYKVFDDPIEPYVIPSGQGLVSYQNADGARLVGLELEARKSLEFLAGALKDFSFIGNLTVAHSRIQLDPSQISTATNPSRAMVNQAPYVINLAIDYENAPLGLDVRLLYNVIGRRIVEVGTQGLDDTYAQPQHTVDATIAKEIVKHLQVKLTGTNLLDAPVRETVGKEDRADRLTLRYKDGRVFTVSGTYTF
jgi:TonB-dependent receptor